MSTREEAIKARQELRDAGLALRKAQERYEAAKQAMRELSSWRRMAPKTVASQNEQSERSDPNHT